MPLSRIPEFIARADQALADAYPGVRTVTFGHVGDGNLHYNPGRPEDWSDDAFSAERENVNRIVHDIVADLNGSISAEHGLSQLRREEVLRYKPAVEIELMRTLKATLDPANIISVVRTFPLSLNRISAKTASSRIARRPKKISKASGSWLRKTRIMGTLVLV